MPKTQNAFAFRRLFLGIELDNRATELVRKRKMKEAQVLREQAQELLFEPFESKEAKEPYEPDRIKGIEQTIRSCDRELTRTRFLLSRVKAHKKRLGKVLSKSDLFSDIFKRTIELQEKYSFVEEVILGHVDLMKNLRKFNEETLRRAFNQELGVRLRLARRRKGISQEEVAKILSVTKASYNHYELGRREIPPLFIYKLSTILEVSTEYLLGTS